MSRADTREEVRRAIERRGGATSAAIAEELGYERGTITTICNEMREAGRMTRRPKPDNPVKWIHEVPTESAEVPADD